MNSLGHNDMKVMPRHHNGDDAEQLLAVIAEKIEARSDVFQEQCPSLGQKVRLLGLFLQASAKLLEDPRHNKNVSVHSHCDDALDNVDFLKLHQHAVSADSKAHVDTKGFLSETMEHVKDEFNILQTLYPAIDNRIQFLGCYLRQCADELFNGNECQNPDTVARRISAARDTAGVQCRRCDF